MKKSKNNKEELEDCDDCLICKVMKDGKGDNAEELMKAFQEAEKKGIGMVGFGNINLNNKSIKSPYSKSH